MRSRNKIILLVVLLLCAVASPFLSGGPFDFFGQTFNLKGINGYYYDILLGAGINVILAVGLNLVNGYTGQFSLGHAGFMAVGAYASSWLTLSFGFILGASVWATTTIFVWTLILGGVAAAAAGLIVGVPSLRLKGDYLAIVTLGFNEIIKGVIQNAEPLGAQRGLGGMMHYSNFFWTFASAALTVYVVLSLVHSTYGRGFLAVRDDEVAAEAMGINTTKYKVLAFVVAAFAAGVAGGLYAHFKQFIHPEGFNYLRSVDVVVMVILGGMGNTVGVCFAAVLLTVLPELLRAFSKSDMLQQAIHGAFGWLSPANFELVSTKAQEFFQNRMILYSILLIVLMLTRPQGLFGGLRLPRRRQATEPK
jgi:branched-chain amino acid transport system permease protein